MPLAETGDEVKTVRDKHGATPVGYLAAIGVLGAPVVAAHCVWLTGEDIEVMVDRFRSIGTRPARLARRD